MGWGAGVVSPRQLSSPIPLTIFLTLALTLTLTLTLTNSLTRPFAHSPIRPLNRSPTPGIIVAEISCRTDFRGIGLFSRRTNTDIPNSRHMVFARIHNPSATVPYEKIPRERTVRTVAGSVASGLVANGSVANGPVASSQSMVVEPLPDNFERLAFAFVRSAHRKGLVTRCPVSRDQVPSRAIPSETLPVIRRLSELRTPRRFWTVDSSKQRKILIPSPTFSSPASFGRARVFCWPNLRCYAPNSAESTGAPRELHPKRRGRTT